MKLIELTRLSGNKSSVNPDYVVSVNPADRGSGTTLLLASQYIDTLTVSEDYATVTRLLTGAVGRVAVGAQ